MLKNADYIYNNIIKADETNTTKRLCKKAQVGVDLTVKSIEKIVDAGHVLVDKTYASKTVPIKPRTIKCKDSKKHLCYKLPRGTYIVVFNEGCRFGPSDTGYVILRSSLNRSGVSIHSAVWDPGYTSVDGDQVLPMSIRMRVDNPHGFIVEQDARVAQLVVVANESTSTYNGQWQGGRKTSKLV